MARHGILIFEPEEASRKLLAKALKRDEYKLFGVRDSRTLIDALHEREFPVVIVDVWNDRRAPAEFVRRLRRTSASMAILVTGTQRDQAALLDVVRAGADDFLLKPFRTEEVQTRVAAALQRYAARVTPPDTGDHDAASEEAADRIAAEGSISQEVRALPDSDVRELLRAVQAFQGQALEVFMELERQHLGMEQRLSLLENRVSSSSMNRQLSMLVAHTDGAVGRTLRQPLESIHCRLLPQAMTGGKVLDEVTQTTIDVVLISEDLPDIPGPMVAATVRAQSEHPTVLSLRGWNTNQMSLAVIGDGGAIEKSEPIASISGFADLVLQHVTHHRHREEARRIVQRFKARHQDFIKAMADIRSRLDGMLRERAL